MRVIVLLVTWAVYSQCAPENERITNLPNLTEPMRSAQYAGYLPIADDKQLFYWYVESEVEPEKAPVVLWLNGGPGCASMEGLFIEMGPYRVKDFGARVERNPWTWNRIANIIYLDAPAGVGLSYYNATKMVFNDDIVANDNMKALKLWFEKFPERKTNDFFIAGESYGGVYVPTLSSLIVQNTDAFPTFKGMLVGNGCVDNKLNYNTGILYQYYHGIIDETQFESTLKDCCANSQDCDFYNVSQSPDKNCADKVEALNEAIFYTGIDPYFIYFSCYLNYPSDASLSSETTRLAVQKRHLLKTYKQKTYEMEKESLTMNMRDAAPPLPECSHHNDHIPYLNDPEVRKILRIPDYVQQYAICNFDISNNYQSQYETMTPFFNKVIAAKKRVALFNGDVDSVCNVAHNAQFLKKNLNKALVSPATPVLDVFQLPQTIGTVTTYDGVSLVTIRGGGHFPAATFQKPKETFQMFQNYIKNQNYSTSVFPDKPYFAQSTIVPTSTLDPVQSTIKAQSTIVPTSTLEPVQSTTKTSEGFKVLGPLAIVFCLLPVIKQFY